MGIPPCPARSSKLSVHIAVLPLNFGADRHSLEVPPPRYILAPPLPDDSPEAPPPSQAETPPPSAKGFVSPAPSTMGNPAPNPVLGDASYPSSFP